MKKKIFSIFLALAFMILPIGLLGCQTQLKIAGISIDTTNVKKEYFAGESFNPNNLLVFVKYKDGFFKELDTTNYTIDASAFNSSTQGMYKIKVNFGKFEESFIVNVSPFKQVVSLQATSIPQFFVSQDMKNSSLEITATYYDNSVQKVSGYNVLSFDNSSAGVKQATIEFNNFEYTFEVEVVSQKNYAINLLNNLEPTLENLTTKKYNRENEVMFSSKDSFYRKSISETFEEIWYQNGVLYIYDQTNQTKTKENLTAEEARTRILGSNIPYIEDEGFGQYQFRDLIVNTIQEMKELDETLIEIQKNNNDFRISTNIDNDSFMLCYIEYGKMTKMRFLGSVLNSEYICDSDFVVPTFNPKEFIEFQPELEG